MEPPVEIRDLARDEFSRIGAIDRTGRIVVRFEQDGTELVERQGTWSAPAWNPDGTGEHSVYAQHQALLHYADEGGIARGAFSNGRLVGIAGIGRRLCADLELIARRAGDTDLVVTATPSENTVRFYVSLGNRPMAQPLPKLLELEPEDIHMSKLI